VKKGFTLFELVIVLSIISLILLISFPKILKNSLSSETSVKNKLRSLFSNSFSLSRPLEICVDFRLNTVSAGNSTVKLPWKVESLVLPGKIFSSKNRSSFCFSSSKLTYGALVFRKGEVYPTLFFTLPFGETVMYELSEAQKDTLKDKVEKGKITEWFSYYSY
jgi:prepilin-type N-terminal cleavage/methylation domain-containing protein